LKKCLSNCHHSFSHSSTTCWTYIKLWNWKPLIFLESSSVDIPIFMDHQFIKLPFHNLSFRFGCISSFSSIIYVINRLMYTNLQSLLPFYFLPSLCVYLFCISLISWSPCLSLVLTGHLTSISTDTVFIVFRVSPL
jgi:hypothetical protein